MSAIEQEPSGKSKVSFEVGARNFKLIVVVF